MLAYIFEHKEKNTILFNCCLCLYILLNKTPENRILLNFFFNLQNNKAGNPVQCNDYGDTSVCRCCCNTDECNIDMHTCLGATGLLL